MDERWLLSADADGALVHAPREQRGTCLVLAGEVGGALFDAYAAICRRRLDDAVKLTGFVPEQLGWQWLAAADLSVNLRGPTSGGASGGIFQSFGVGRAVIASDAAEQRELPDACTVKVPLGEGEVKGIAAELVALSSDAPRRAALEAAVRKFVLSECHWSHVATTLLAHLERFPAARRARKRAVAAR